MNLPYPIETTNQIQPTMPLEEYNQLGSNFAHCSGANCERANECLQHAAHKMLAKNTRESYAVANPAVITGAQPCPLFAPGPQPAHRLEVPFFQKENLVSHL